MRPGARETTRKKWEENNGGAFEPWEKVKNMTVLRKMRPKGVLESRFISEDQGQVLLVDDRGKSGIRCEVGLKIWIGKHSGHEVGPVDIGRGKRCSKHRWRLIASC